MFSTDRSHWGFTGRRIKMPVQPDDSGKFRVTDLPAGEYFIAATTDIDPSDLQDPTALEALAAKAATLTLAEGEKKTQDFKIGGPISPAA